MKRPVKKLLFACCGLATLLLVSCGGGGGGGGGVSNVAAGPGTGTVALLATDAPTGEFDQINLTIIKAELISDGGRVTVFTGEKEFDLLELTEVTEVFSVSDAPEGSYNKIRLTLSQIELVFKDDRDPAYPKLPGNGKLDLNPRETFYVDSDKPLVIQLDFDAGKSIHVVEAGNGGRYNFRPVVFVKVAEGEFDTKLVRQRGTVNEIDLDDGIFRLCLIEAEIQPVPVPDDDLPDCVTVDTTSVPASIFDDFANPAELEDFELGDILTVVGRFAFRDDDTEVTPLNNGKGNNKNNGNGKGNKEGAGDGDDPIEEGDDDRDESDSVSTLGDDGTLVLVAEVIWRGDDITQTDNVACTEVFEGSDRGTWYENRELPFPDDEECDSGGARPTILQPGARIYDADGNPVPETAITEGSLNQVDGYLDIGENPDELKAVLVMLRPGEDSPDQAQLTGTIGDIDAGESLILMTEGGDRCVNFSAASTEVFETGIDEEGNVLFNQEDVGALMSGQKANAFGAVNSDGCLKAHTIIYEEEASIQPI